MSGPSPHPLNIHGCFSVHLLIYTCTCLCPQQEHFVYPAKSQDDPPDGYCVACGLPFSDSCPRPRLRLHRPAIIQVGPTLYTTILLHNRILDKGSTLHMWVYEASRSTLSAGTPYTKSQCNHMKAYYYNGWSLMYLVNTYKISVPP